MTGSHRQWAEGYARSSALDVRLQSMPGRFWKWRMHGAAVTLAARIADGRPDVLLCSDMLDVAALLGLARDRLSSTPTVLYMHENQLAYPATESDAGWSDSRRRRAARRDEHYPFINLTSALAADVVVWNSRHNRDSFLSALPGFLRAFPDEREFAAVDCVAGKSLVLPVGLDLAELDRARTARPRPRLPRIVWNHRWEHDKDPGTFFRALQDLDARGARFEVVLLGESFVHTPPVFQEMRSYLGSRLVHYGHVDDRQGYARHLWESDVVVSTARHEFFGVAVCEAVYCGCLPVLPNRLAYPELVPRDLGDAVLYDDFDGLVGRLAQAIADPSAAARDALRASVRRFDWPRVAAAYDELLVGTARGDRPSAGSVAGRPVQPGKGVGDRMTRAAI
jgi:glycosyltransferase involved in cell wall biosynthesis